MYRWRMFLYKSNKLDLYFSNKFCMRISIYNKRGFFKTFTTKNTPNQSLQPYLFWWPFGKLLYICSKWGNWNCSAMQHKKCLWIFMRLKCVIGGYVFELLQLFSKAVAHVFLVYQQITVDPFSLNSLSVL